MSAVSGTPGGGGLAVGGWRGGEFGVLTCAVPGECSGRTLADHGIRRVRDSQLGNARNLANVSHGARKIIILTY